MTETVETSKLKRLKSKWKPLLASVLGLFGVIYFVATGEEIDISSIIGWLQ